MKKEKVFAVIGSVLLALLVVASAIITAISPIVWGENKKVSAAVGPFDAVDGVWLFPNTLTLLEKYAGESYDTNDFTVFFGYEERMAFPGGVFSVHFDSTQIRVQSGFGQFTTIFDASKPSAERWLSNDYKYWHVELKDDSMSEEVLALLNDLASKQSDDINDYYPFTPPAEPFEAYVSSIADTSVLSGVWFLKDDLAISSTFSVSVLFTAGYSGSPAFTSFTVQGGELIYFSTITSFPAYTSSGWTSSGYRLLFFPVGASSAQLLTFLQSNAIKVSDQTTWNDSDLTWSGALPPDVSAGTQFPASDFDGIEPTSPAGTWLFYNPVNPRYFCSDINADYDFDFYVNFYYGYKFGRMYMEDMSSSGAGNFYLRYSVPVDRPVPSVNPIPAYLGIQTSTTGWSRQQFRLIQIPQASSYPEGLIQFLRKNAIKLSDYASIDEGTPDPPTEYTVTYNVNGGSLSTGFLTETVTEGDHPVSPPTVVRNGYTFAGWSLSSSGSAVDLASYTVTSNVTFYALWTQNSEQYTVTYDANGGSLSAGSLTETVTEGDHPVSPPTVVRNGYTFAGWSLSSSGSAVDLASYTVTSDVTFYALWTQNSEQYTVTYDVNGGSLSAGSLMEVVAVGGSPSSSPTVVRNNFTFVGWALSPMGTVIDLDTYSVTTDVTLYARWTAVVGDNPTYSVMLAAGDGAYFLGDDGEHLDAIVVTGPVGASVADIYFDLPVRPGYTVDGWYYVADRHIFVELEHIQFGTNTQGMLYFAHWQLDAPSGMTVVDFDIGSGGFPDYDGNKSFIISPGVFPSSLYPGDPVRPEYKFLGWSISEDGELVDIDLSTYVFGEGHYTVIARWSYVGDGTIKNPLIFFVQPIQTFMDFPIFGSLSIGDVLGMLLFVFLGLIFLKMFAGG